MSDDRASCDVSVWSADESTQLLLEGVEQELWSVVARYGPTPRLRAAVIGALDPAPPPYHGDPHQALCGRIRSLIAEGVDARLVRHVVLDSLRVAQVVWEAFEDGFRAGVESASQGALA